MLNTLRDSMQRVVLVERHYRIFSASNSHNFQCFQRPILTPSTVDTLFQFFIGISQQVEQEGIGIQVDLVARFGHNISNITGRIDSSQLHKSRILLYSQTNELC